MALQQPPHPIFLISVARSGTNLFIHLFSEHPQIVPKDYAFFNAYLFGPENQRGKEVTESDNPSGIPVGGSLLDETFQKAYNRLESSTASITQDEGSVQTVLFKDHSQMLLKTSFFQSQKPDWASPSPKIDKAIESVTSPNPALSNLLPSPAGTVRNPTYLPDGFLGLFSPVILIRHPAILVPSFYRAMLRESEIHSLDRLYNWEVHGSQTSPNAQWALWEWYNERADRAEAGAVIDSHLRPLVIDMDLDLLSQPAETVCFLLETLNSSSHPLGALRSKAPRFCVVVRPSQVSPLYPPLSSVPFPPGGGPRSMKT